MPEPLRYTGCFPPKAVMAQYPNWECAIDEEGEPGQDEHTLKPEDQQAFVSNDTAYTRGEILFANGRSELAVLGLLSGKLISIALLNEPFWQFGHDEATQAFEPVIEDWLPEADRTPLAPTWDTEWFPAAARSILPYYSDSPLVARIERAGTQPDSAPSLFRKFSLLFGKRKR